VAEACILGDVHGDAPGLVGGVAKIGNGIVDIESAGDNQNVIFQAGGTGGLDLGVLGSAYTGVVSGFGQNVHQLIDFTAIGSAGDVELHVNHIEQRRADGDQWRYIGKH
jgi:hypothetical protein